MFIDGTIRKYIDQASAGTPTPGGGSVSALAGALGLSMACMATNYTVGRAKYTEAHPGRMEALLEKFEIARETLLRLTEEDSKVYEFLSATLAMPKQTEEEKATRNAIMQEAVTNAMNVPLEVVRVCRAVLEELVVLAEIGNKNLISDVGVAAVLAEAALRAAKLNVEVNLRYLKDEAKVAGVRKEVDEARSNAADNLKKVSETVAAGIKGTP
jgi:formiminotetrahydrofolate cyclodeaminase